MRILRCCWVMFLLLRSIPGIAEELGFNTPSQGDREWSHDVCFSRIETSAENVQVVNVLRGDEYGNASVKLQAELCSQILNERRSEAELWWYEEVGAACSDSSRLPSLPKQEPALFLYEGDAVITRFGSIISASGSVVLDPDQHGICHRMRVPDDLSQRAVPGTNGYNPPVLSDVFVLSQPWGHSPFHFIAECLPKLSLAPPSLLAGPTLIHVPLSPGPVQTAERVMIEEYLAVLGVENTRIVSGEVFVRGRVHFVTPARCVVPAPVLLRALRERLWERLLRPRDATEEEKKREEDEEEAEDEDEEERKRHVACMSRNNQAAETRSRGGGEERRGLGEERMAVLLIQRAGATRRLSRRSQAQIAHTLQASGLTLLVYDAASGQAPATTLASFACARGVIAPHGAGLANLVATMAGSSLLELHPSVPTAPSSGLAGLNLCNLHLARSLAIHYTGGVMTPGEEEETNTEPGGAVWDVENEVVEGWVRELKATDAISPTSS